MILKDYQAQAIRNLEDFLKLLDENKHISEAFKNFGRPVTLILSRPIRTISRTCHKSVSKSRPVAVKLSWQLQA